MRLENQVCSLEQAKRLKELGVKQESLFYCQNNEVTHTPVEKPSYNDKDMRCSVCFFDLNVYGKEITCHCSKWVAKDNMEPWEWVGFASGNYITYSAFTVSELGEMLPKRLNATKTEGEWVATLTPSLELEVTESEFIVRYPLLQTIGSTNEAIARAQMLIYLLENKLISL